MDEYVTAVVIFVAGIGLGWALGTDAVFKECATSGIAKFTHGSTIACNVVKEVK